MKCSAKEAQHLRDQLEEAKRRAQQAELAKSSITSQVTWFMRQVGVAVQHA